MAEDRKETDLPEWQHALRTALHEMPQEYKAFYEDITKMRQTLLKEMAAAIQERLNKYLQDLPQYSLEDKRQIAYQVNQDLRLLNLCLRCPVTGLPAILVGDYGANPERENRFRFEIHQNGRQLRKGMFHTIPKLDVMPAPPRVERMSNQRRSQP